jgi:DNA helicase IV
VAHPELALEQQHLDRARQAAAAMSGRTQRALEEAESAATEADSEVARFHLRRRLSSLEDRGGVPAFGRMDEGGSRWYVGRRHIEDESGNPMVVDWRAPVSVPFYRATVHEPLGLDRRRRFTADGDRLVDILEEDFTDPDGAAVAGGIPDPLLAELDRQRTGTMRDIVATIAAEQDAVIRTPIDRLLVVQGGPGTGKTAVALHRAAYLLYEHRTELLETGVLVVGPNPVFLRYVSEVLPSLGETAVRQTTVEGLRPPSVRLGRDEPPEVGRIKGDARMAGVVARALRNSIRLPRDPVSIHADRGTVRLRPESVAAAVEDVLARDVPHAVGKEALRSRLLHEAYSTHERTAEVPALKPDFVAAARTDVGFRRFVDRTWPTLSAPSLIQKLLGSASARDRATSGLLDHHERDLLGRETSRRVGEERWSSSDVALLDEAESRINGHRATYGHVVIDEAQDLSAMALRMLSRRSRNGSMTVVGDLAQGTTLWASRSWDDVAAVLEGASPVQRAELTVGYRTPAPILDLANRLLVEAAPGVTPARSIRSSGAAPMIERSDDPVRSAAAHLAEWSAGSHTGRGTVAMVATRSAHGQIGQALDAAGIAWGSDGPQLDRGVTVLDPLLAKGLEFDVVVVVEPADIVDAEPAGHRALFVALTRATRQLVVVHARELPEALTA